MSELTERLTEHDKAYNPHAFLKIERAMLAELDGDLSACALYAHLRYLLGTDQAQIDNDGWAILRDDDIEEKLFMGRKALLRAIGVLTERAGLIVKLKLSRIHHAPVKHFRFDEAKRDIFVGQVNARYTETMKARKAEMKERRKGRIAKTTSTRVRFDQKAHNRFDQKAQILEEEVLREDLKNYAPDGAGRVENPLHSKAKAPRPVHSDNTNGDFSAPPPVDAYKRTQMKNKPTPTDTTPQPANDYQYVFREVRRLFFGVIDGIGADDKTTGKIQRLAGYLWSESPRPQTEPLEDKRAGLVSDIANFTKWWKRHYKDASLPLSPESLSAHWARFISTRPAHAPTANYTMVEWGGNVKTDSTSLQWGTGGGATMNVNQEIVPMVIDKALDMKFIFGNSEKDNDND